MRGPQTPGVRPEVETRWRSGEDGEDRQGGTGLRCTEEETDPDWWWWGSRTIPRCPHREVGAGSLEVSACDGKLGESGLGWCWAQWSYGQTLGPEEMTWLESRRGLCQCRGGAEAMGGVEEREGGWEQIRLRGR